MREILEASASASEASRRRKERPSSLPLLRCTRSEAASEADKRYWQSGSRQLGKELETEPQRIRQSYDVKAPRFEPVGPACICGR